MEVDVVQRVQGRIAKARGGCESGYLLREASNFVLQILTKQTDKKKGEKRKEENRREERGRKREGEGRERKADRNREEKRR